MDNTKTAEEKPDFETMAIISAKLMVEDGEDPDYEVGYYNGCNRIWNDYVIPSTKNIEAVYTERELEIAYCIGLLNHGLTIDELSEALKSANEKLSNLKEAIKRGDFNPSTNGK